MAAPTPAQLLPLWYRAAESEFGIAVATNDIPWLKAVLYEARTQAADPALDKVQLSTVAPPHEHEVWLVKKDVELD